MSIGIDIGGTFTDIVLLVESGRQPFIAWTKVPSTPQNPVDGVIAAMKKGLDRVDESVGSVSRFMHATTVGTNAILEEKGARLGLLSTEGFEDTLEIGRQKRTQMYELALEPETPVFLCPGERRFGVEERIAFDGEVLKSLNEDGLREICSRLQDLEVEAVAVSYLFSFQNGEHEVRTRQIIQELMPGTSVSISHEVNPVFREYERLLVTAFDAYLRPVMETYLRKLSGDLDRQGMKGTLLTMKSRGGLASVDGALERPVTTMLSGPAAGVVGARAIAHSMDAPNVITLDMGGTSADISVVKQGKPLTSTRGGVGKYPLQIPMVDVQTIGAGGGSIAWLDAAGGLRVGPHSAGSNPGPACYGEGGEEPTVTDASVVLGYIAPESFLGGDRVLDYDAAYKAIERLAITLGLTVEQTALGIHQIVNSKMADAIRLASIKRGYDLRRFDLMLFGGAGPVNGAALADDLGISRAIVPRSPGVLSALGLLVSDVEYDNTQTFLEKLSTSPINRANEIFRNLEALGFDQMIKDGYEADECHVRHSADMRFVGQSSELEVPLQVPLEAAHLEKVESDFRAEHEQVYGYAPPGGDIEFVNLRTVHVRSPNLDIREALKVEAIAAEARAEASTSRKCVFAEGIFDAAVHQREDLTSGMTFEGPAIVQQEDSTVVVYPNDTCVIDDSGNLIIQT